MLSIIIIIPCQVFSICVVIVLKIPTKVPLYSFKISVIGGDLAILLRFSHCY